MRFPARLASTAAIVLASAAAFGQSMIITLSNDSTNSLYVTVYDMNAQPPLKVLVNASVNGNASITVSISPDSSNQGHLFWTATTVDRDMRACGRGNSDELNDGDSVSITADSDCSGQ